MPTMIDIGTGSIHRICIQDNPELFIVSLQRRQDRRDAIKEHFKQNGLKSRIWYACEDKDGATGLRMTMKHLFSYCVAKEMPCCGVFEDDCEFLESPGSLDKCFAELPEGFHLFYPGLTLLVPPDKVSDNLLRVRAAYSTHSVFYSLEAMKLILPLLDNPEPYDIILKNHIQPLGQSYCSRQLVTTQKTYSSDIFKPTEEELNKNPVMKQIYNPKTGEVNWGHIITGSFKQHTANL